MCFCFLLQIYTDFLEYNVSLTVFESRLRCFNKFFDKILTKLVVNRKNFANFAHHF